MKLIVLTDAKLCEYDDMSGKLVGNALVANTETLEEEEEYQRINSLINTFNRMSAYDILLVKFSGRESIVRELGDCRRELIICLSRNRESKYYSPEPLISVLNRMFLLEIALLSGE